MEIITRSEAKAKGLKRYFTGKACKNGHVAERFTTAPYRCVVCNSERYSRAYQKNRTHILQKNKIWADENPEKRKEHAEKYRANNQEKIKEAQAKFRKSKTYLAWCERFKRENGELLLKKSRNWYNDNKDRHNANQKRWYKNNKKRHAQNIKKARTAKPDLYAEIHRTCQRNRRARKNNSTEVHCKNDIEFLIIAQNGKCYYCLKQVKNNYHVDHKMPLSKGGSNGRDNLCIACPSCNLRKHAKDPIEFARELGRLL